MYSYVGFLNGRLNISGEEEFVTNHLPARQKNGSAFCGAPSFYACQDVFSTLTSAEIPQPDGKVITDDMWESFMRLD